MEDVILSACFKSLIKFEVSNITIESLNYNYIVGIHDEVIGWVKE